jgi:hypothetical protein
MASKPNADVPKWSVPREWVGDRCFVLGGGASLKEQVPLLGKLRGRIIAIKQTVYHRPNADVMLLASREDPKICKKFFPLFKGKRMICRSNYPGMPAGTCHLRRTNGGAYSRDPQLVGGLDAGATAINLAALFGAKEIILLGLDMCGGRWVKGHPLPVIPPWHFQLHLEGLAKMAPELAKDGIRVVNCSPISAIPDFEKRPLSEFL